MKITERKTNTKILEEMKVGDTITVEFVDFQSWRSLASILKRKGKGSWTTKIDKSKNNVTGKLTRES